MRLTRQSVAPGGEQLVDLSSVQTVDASVFVAGTVGISSTAASIQVQEFEAAGGDPLLVELAKEHLSSAKAASGQGDPINAIGL